MKKETVFNGGLLAVSFVVALFILELASGYLFKHLPEKFNNGKRIVEIYMGEKPSVPNSIEPHPYILYQNTPHYSADGFLQHNSKRYRNKEFEIDKTKDNVSTRIVVLGGSTTYMFPYVKNPEDTWVAQLEGHLRKNIDAHIQVINAGQTYATSAELLAAYVFRHRYLHPDILVVEAGGNDIAALMFDHYDPEYAHFRTHGSGLIPRHYERTLLRNSRFFRLVYAVWLNKLETVYKSQPGDFDELDPKEVLSRVEHNESLGLRRNLDGLIKYAQADGVKVVLIGFLQAREQFLSRNRPDLKGLEKAWGLGLEKHDKIMDEISSEYKIPFIKLDQDSFDDSWFQDNCHLNEKGEAVKASILNEFFVKHRNEYFEIKEKK